MTLRVPCGEYRRPVLVLGLVVSTVLGSPCFARPRPVVKIRTTLDRDYVSALSTANRFLQACQTHDQENGLMLLSDAAKRQTSADHLESFFAQDHSAYEITRGKRLAPDRYQFSVVLFEAGAGRLHRQFGDLILCKSGKDDWLVDKLPSR